MWIYSLEIARERIRQLEDDARTDRLAREAMLSRRLERRRARGRVRPAVAAALRTVSSAADQLASTAYRAAARVEGRAA
jgi:hypothetical protein